MGSVEVAQKEPGAGLTVRVGLFARVGWAVWRDGMVRTAFPRIRRWYRSSRTATVSLQSAVRPTSHAFDAWMDRDFPDCPFERHADDGLIHCRSQARARQALAALRLPAP